MRYLQHIVCEVLWVWAGEPDTHLSIHQRNTLQQLVKLHSTITLGFTDTTEPWSIHRPTAATAAAAGRLLGQRLLLL
jgi:hypothetical protein